MSYLLDMSQYKYIPNTLAAIQMVAMATRKIIYAHFHGNGQSYACLTELYVFVGPKYTCMSQIVLISSRNHKKISRVSKI